MKLIDRYVLRKFLGTFIYAILLFSAISVAIDLSDRIDDFLEHKVPFVTVLTEYYGNFVPYIVFLLSPMFIFIAVIFFTAQLANRSEIVAIISGGISFYRLLFVPYLFGAALLTALQLYGNHYWVPKSNRTRFEFESQYLNRKFVSKDRNMHLQMDKETFVYVENYNNKDSIGSKFTLETIQDKHLTRKISADKIRWKGEKKQWALENYTDRRIDSLQESLVKGDKLDTTLNLLPSDFERKVNFKEAMTSVELQAFLEKERRKGVPFIEFYEVELHRRTAIPFATFILTGIGFAIASRKVRGGMGVHLAVGIALSALYIIFLQFSTTFATNGGLSPLLSVWIPNIVFALVAVYLVGKAQK